MNKLFKVSLIAFTTILSIVFSSCSVEVTDADDDNNSDYYENVSLYIYPASSGYFTMEDMDNNETYENVRWSLSRTSTYYNDPMGLSSARVYSNYVNCYPYYDLNTTLAVTYSLPVGTTIRLYPDETIEAYMANGSDYSYGKSIQYWEGEVTGTSDNGLKVALDKVVLNK